VNNVDCGQRPTSLVVRLVLRLRRDRDRSCERDWIAPLERRKRVRPHDAVATQVELVLHELHSVQRRTVEVGVHGDIEALADEQELKNRDVPAEVAPVKGAGAE
jgi:hypothetical protein